jgi:hypothetical protein
MPVNVTMNDPYSRVVSLDPHYLKIYNKIQKKIQRIG